MVDIKLAEVENLKIVPENYKSSTVFDIEEIQSDKVIINLPKATKKELEDYKEGSTFSAFGLSSEGLIYFEGEILDRKNGKVLLKYPFELRQIQRRKYTRVPFSGKLTFVDFPSSEIKTEDLSAGGMKFYSNTLFEVGKEYEIRLELLNNLIVECSIAPIRVVRKEADRDIPYSVSAKFVKIRSIDRIALMQYSLRLKAEMENKA